MSPKMPLEAPTVTASPKMKVPTEPATAERTYTARKMSPPSTCTKQRSETEVSRLHLTSRWGWSD